MTDKDLLGFNKAEPDHSNDDEKPGMDKMGFNAPKNDEDIWAKSDDE